MVILCQPADMAEFNEMPMVIDRFTVALVFLHPIMDQCSPAARVYQYMFRFFMQSWL